MSRVGENIGIIERTVHKTQRPVFYVVALHNDPVTPRAFVVVVLRKFFGKSEEEATRIMMLAHNYGVGVVAQFSKDVAEAKVVQVINYSKDNGYPLHFSVEEQ
jgi:ATP-dependent Clp protease adaptor protein ClpS